MSKTTKNVPADKARQQAMARIESVNRQIDEALAVFGADKDKTESARDAKAFKAKVDAASRDPGPAATKTLAGLVKTGEALVKTITQRGYDLFASTRRKELHGVVNAALAGALLDLGKIADPALTKLMFAEQSALRKRMDKAEKTKSDIDAVSEMDDLDDEMPAFQKRLQSALAVSAWLGTGYKSTLALTESAIASVPSAHSRKVLRAELDFVAAAKNGALAKLQVKAIESATVPMLRRLQKVATRLSAGGATLDQKLVRVGKLIKDAGAPQELTAQLKKLARDKAAGWPQVRDFEDFEKALDDFEKSLAELAASAQKAKGATPR